MVSMALSAAEPVVPPTFLQRLKTFLYPFGNKAPRAWTNP
jgi:hypothetical protein